MQRIGRTRGKLLFAYRLYQKTSCGAKQMGAARELEVRGELVNKKAKAVFLATYKFNGPFASQS